MSALSSIVAALDARSDTENLLLEIWRRVLRVPEIDCDSDFFEIGGDSLLAVNLFLEIERETGVNLPLTAIYDAPTVGEMASLVREEVERTYSPLVLLKPGTGRPLFIVHGIGGTVMELAALGRQIAIPEPVYAIQAKGLDGRALPLTRIGDMAESYVNAVRAIQPSGPYWLCGYSFGGLVAMEMARRFEAAGAEIAALILIDAFAHPSTWPFLSRAKMRLRRAGHLLRIGAGRPLEETLRLAFRRARMKGESERLHEWLLDFHPGLPLPLRRVREAGSVALREYRPAPYAGAITFLKAYRRDTEFPGDPERIWNPIASQIAYRTIPGGHRTVVTQHAAEAAAALTDCVSAARSSWRTPVRAIAERIQPGGTPALQSQMV
jgi:acetoacetyl-CoA synthetase